MQAAMTRSVWRRIGLVVAACFIAGAPVPVSALFQDGDEGLAWLTTKIGQSYGGGSDAPSPPGTIAAALAIPVKVCFRKTGTKDKDRPGTPYTVNYTAQEMIPERDMVKDALNSSWGKWTNLIFQGFGDCPEKLDGYLYVDLIKQDCGGCGDAIPRGYNPKGVRVWLMNENPDDRLLRSVIIHEIGHALGFHHEMDRPDAKWPDGTWICTNGPVAHPQGIKLSAMYDDVSIMNYCATRNRNGLSFGDIEGAQKLYGTSAAGRWLKALPSLSLYAM